MSAREIEGENASVYGLSVHRGNAGEHLVMAHLLVRGFQAFHADRGNPAFDISVVDGDCHSLIRVKTTTSDSLVWSRKRDGTTSLDIRSNGDFCAIVDLRNGVAAASIYIVPTPVVRDALAEARRYWNAGVKQDGSKRKDGTGQRLWLNDRTDRHAYEGFQAKWAPFRDNWDLLRGSRPIGGINGSSEEMKRLRVGTAVAGKVRLRPRNS